LGHGHRELGIEVLHDFVWIIFQRAIHEVFGVVVEVVIVDCVYELASAVDYPGRSQWF
jgi:hypothetical protein